MGFKKIIEKFRLKLIVCRGICFKFNSVQNSMHRKCHAIFLCNKRSTNARTIPSCRMKKNLHERMWKVLVEFIPWKNYDSGSLVSKFVFSMHYCTWKQLFFSKSSTRLPWWIRAILGKLFHLFSELMICWVFHRITCCWKLSITVKLWL